MSAYQQLKLPFAPQTFVQLKRPKCAKTEQVPPYISKYNVVRLYQHKNGHSYYRVKKQRGWVMLHRYMWELFFGQVPAGYRVAFKDGNSLNCHLENLELINGQQARKLQAKKGRQTKAKNRNKKKLFTKYGLDFLNR